MQLASAAPCLGLPPLLFSALLQWLPAECASRSAAADDGGGGGGLGGARPELWRCVLPRSLEGSRQLAALPALEFRLREGGPVLRLPLADLVLAADSSGRRPLCLHASAAEPQPAAAEPAAEGSDGAAAAAPAPRAPIVLGAAALQSLLTVLQLEPGGARVGLAQQPGAAWSDAEERDHRAHCLPAAQCRGQERFDPAANRCVPPECGVYVHTLDRARGVCAFPPHFRTAALLIISIVALADCASFEGHKLVGRRVRLRTPSSSAHAREQ